MYVYLERYEHPVTTEKSKERFSLRFHGRNVIDGSDDWYREPIRYPRDITQTHLEKLLILYITTLVILVYAVTLMPSAILSATCQEFLSPS